MRAKPFPGGLRAAGGALWGGILRHTAGGACVLLLVAGCASPAARHEAAAAALGLRRGIVAGAGYEHVVYRRSSATADAVHVYLDGDGTPWLQGRWPSADPTPRDPLVLELAASDPNGVYVGRPCYLGARGDNGCPDRLWTSARYGEAVVSSMTRALRAVRAEHESLPLVLVGYSGGGTLAMLVAERLADVRAVVTVAANLDVEAWRNAHDYLPLEGSLNPAARAPLPARIRQTHLVGSKDANVLPAVVKAEAARQPGARFVQVEGFDHICCWRGAWPRLLREALAEHD